MRCAKCRRLLDPEAIERRRLGQRGYLVICWVCDAKMHGEDVIVVVAPLPESDLDWRRRMGLEERAWRP